MLNGTTFIRVFIFDGGYINDKLMNTNHYYNQQLKTINTTCYKI